MYSEKKICREHPKFSSQRWSGSENIDSSFYVIRPSISYFLLRDFWGQLSVVPLFSSLSFLLFSGPSMLRFLSHYYFFKDLFKRKGRIESEKESSHIWGQSAKGEENLAVTSIWPRSENMGLSPSRKRLCGRMNQKVCEDYVTGAILDVVSCM